MNTPYIWLGLLGLVAGVLSGLFGIGGGVIIVLGLTALGLNQKVATGTSLAALALPLGVMVATYEYHRRGEVKPEWAVVLLISMILGGFIGARLTAPMSPTLLKRLFGVFLIVMGIKSLWK